ncbi:DUF2523 family protein [Arhodomonas sp. AD133]|uniref:DUF2523 family protein n=1 Tax=Arhodomonas sp. AD133 TaxID=3415009 RepID=UPI003EB81324
MDFSWVGELFEGFQWILDWFNSGIYDFFVEWTAFFTQKAAIAAISAQVAAMQFAWDVARQILADIGVTGYINSAWGQLPADFRGVLGFFRIPEAVNLVANSYATRLVMQFLGLGMKASG